MVLTSGCFALKEYKLKNPHLFGLEQIASNVYASEDMDVEQRQSLLIEIKKAKPKLAKVFGSIATKPMVYAFTREQQYKSFGGYGSGRATSNGIMLLPQTMVASAIAHEWTHVELYARTGKTGYKKMPMWFHEGLATLVGDVPRHSEAVWQEAVNSGFPIPTLDEMVTLEDWSTVFRKYTNPKGFNVVYATAGHEVRNWYKRAGQQGLLELLTAIRGDREFYDVYNRY